MSQFQTPRRPASLEQSQAEQIPGDEDPMKSAEIAHQVAHTLLGWQDNSDETLRRLQEVIRDGGVELVSELWSTSPATTLPGALWRLYLVHQWYLRDPELVLDRFSRGLAAAHKVSGPPESFPNPLEIRQAAGKIMNELAGLWRAELVTPLAQLLYRVADFLFTLSGGVNAKWIEDDQDELADHVTLRPEALLRTAEEMRVCAKKAARQQLD